MKKPCYMGCFYILFATLFMSSCTKPPETTVGYIEGEYTYISSGASGKLMQLLVKRGQFIENGKLLYLLDPEPERSRLNVTKANIAELQALVAFAKIQYER